MSDTNNTNDETCARVATTEQLKAINAAAIASGFKNTIPLEALEVLDPNGKHVGHPVPTDPNEDGSISIHWLAMVSGQDLPMSGYSNVAPGAFMALPSCEEVLESLFTDAISKILDGATV